MLIIAGAVRRQNYCEEEHSIGEQVDGTTTDSQGEGDQNQIGETLSESRHDRQVEQILLVLAFLDGVFVLEERDD